MSKRHAIVFTYIGSEPNVDTLNRMTGALRECLEFGKKVESFVLNEDDIAKAITGYVRTDTSKDSIYTNKEDDAAVYIGSRFADSIKKGISPFIADLSANYIFGCIQKSDEPLKKAVIILSQPDAYRKMTSPVCIKYGITPSVVDAIREMYETTCAGHEIVIG